MNARKLLTYIVLILIMALTVTACSGDKEEVVDKTPVENPKDEDSNEDLEESEKPKEEDEEEKDEEEKDEEENSRDDGEILKEFKIIAEKLPTPDVLIKFIDENIEKVSKEDADQMVAGLETSLEDNKQTYADRIFELDKDDELINIDGDQVDFNPSNIENIKDEKLRVEVQYVYENMYKLTNLEGAFYPIVDYKDLQKYDEYLSQEGKDYMSIRNIDSQERPMSDGSLNISFDELLSRIFQAEEFLTDYPDAIKKAEMLEEYDYKINAYLVGLPNTPIMNFETKKIKDEVLASYKSAAQKDKHFSKVVEEHLNNIEENENIIDDEIIRKAYELVKKALEKF